MRDNQKPVLPHELLLEQLGEQRLAERLSMTKRSEILAQSNSKLYRSVPLKKEDSPCHTKRKRLKLPSVHPQRSI